MKRIKTKSVIPGLLAMVIFVITGAFQCCTSEEWPESSLIFAADETVVPDHSDGVPVKDMYQCYREPIVIKTKTGRLVVGCHAGNKLEWPERSGQDYVVRYSDDGGKSWSEPVLAAEHGVYSFQANGMVYDAIIDRIIVKYQLYRFDYSKVEGRGREAAAPAIRETLDAGEAFSKQYVVYSDDGGESWSEPEEIPVDNENDMPHYGSSEGRQLTLGDKAGRLIIPGGIRQHDEGVENRKTIGVWISDDHGQNWEFIRIKEDDPRSISCEARVTELKDGSILYNERTRFDGRHLARSTDGGSTWSQLQSHPDLKVTQCNGSMITLRDKNGKLTSDLLFSVPSPGGRKDGWIYVSRDEGNSWPGWHQPVDGYFAYSSLIQVDAETVCLFYEANHYKDIRSMLIPISKLLSE
ncbi:MAG TPA: exo-alpha-sialidase [Bacteroides sp.]|nr:exo-alpha-sialidase [Bacteroides sp.]